ncbi:MAG: ROK family transcriptional regulator [Clostridiales bacterium]|nr:ROK family transcriptional regulator [Clostridiales bacterium]
MPRLNSTKFNHMQTLLRALYRTPNATKPQLSQDTGLPGSTVHLVITELTKSGIICESGIAASSGGRRATRYQINHDYGVLVAVSMRINEVELGIFDLSGLCLTSQILSLSCLDMGPETYTAEVAGAIQNMLAVHVQDKRRCIGVGVTVPGSVDCETGIVLQMSGAPLWQSFPLSDRLREALGLRVVVDKDVYACVHYLDHSGQMRRNRCTVYLSICEGIGSAVMINGEVFRGTHNLAGEIGHMTVRRDGIPCRCGNTGCLELYCSDIGIIKQYNAHVNEDLSSTDEVLDMMKSGDRIASKVISQAIRYLVDTTSTIFMTYDPDELIIYCRWLNQQRGLYFSMLDSLYKKSMFTQKHAVDIRLLGDESFNLLGAVAIAQSELLIKRCDELIDYRAEMNI